MTDPIRALCAELVEAWDTTSDFDYNDFGNLAKPLIARARAELAEPGAEPPAGAERPSDEEIMALMPQQMREDLAAATRAMAAQAGIDSRRAMGAMRIILNRHAVDLALAVLDRWGQPPAPPSEGEVAELVAWLKENAEDERQMSRGDNPASLKLDRAAELLERYALLHQGKEAKP